MRKRRALVLLGIATTLSAFALAQTDAGDPFLEALSDEEDKQEQAAAQAKDEKQALAKAAKQRAAAAANDPYANIPIEELLHPTLGAVRRAEKLLGGDTGILSQEMAFEGKTISRINVRFLTAQRNVPTQRLINQISLKAGMPYSSVRANADLERLIEEGLIASDARISVYPEGSKVRVVFEVGSANLVGGVGFVGNRMFDQDDLRDEIKLRSGRMVNDKDIAAAREALLKYYHEARYPKVKIGWEEHRTSAPQYRDIVFTINEGPRGEIVDIKFQGNKQFDGEQLRRVMKTQEKGMLYFLTQSGSYSEAGLEDDLDALIKHYRNFGYLRAQVADVKYYNVGTPAHEKLRMVVTINEGPRYRVRRVGFQGNRVFNHQQLEPALSMIGGDIYSLKKVSDDMRLVRSYYGSKGYADAHVRPDIVEAGYDKKTGMYNIDIVYKVEEGRPYQVGRVNVRGNTKTRPHVILRELPLKPGAPLNSVDLETARRRLRNLGYFENVSVSQTASITPGYRDVNINVTERRTGDLRFGVSFSTDSSVALFATVTQANFDIRGFTNGVFVGGGQRLTLSANIGTEYQTASLFLLEPWFFDQKLAFGNEIYFSSSDYLSDYYSQKNYGFATSLRRSLSDEASVKLEYRLERYEIDATGDAPSYFVENSGAFNRSHLELSYKYDTRDAVILPRKGGHIEALLGYSGPGSTVQTYSAGLTGSYYYNSVWDSIFSVKFGMKAVDTVDSSETVPLFEACHLGGPHDLRGFRYRDVGIVDELRAGDETIGGNSSFYAQFEVTVPIIETLRLAVFADVGFVHAGSFDFAPELWAADVGIGLRLNLPMGPLAADFAIPVASDNAIDDGAQFQFYANYAY